MRRPFEVENRRIERYGLHVGALDRKDKKFVSAGHFRDTLLRFGMAEEKTLWFRFAINNDLQDRALKAV